VIVTHLTKTAFLTKNITLKVARLLVETCWWKYHKLKYIVKLKFICWLMILFIKENILFGNILLNGDGNAHSYLNLSLLIISVFIQSWVTIWQVWWLWTPQSDLYNVNKETYHNLISNKIFKIKGPILQSVI